ncbi:Telomerase reverse transcriptase [Caenorhabditis elegans]|nr:Telomerase reverse transcriptase [Caenorhabditis elegans]CAC42278.1 Telomerase reverse transcriptase [Caenorhabditis elegans]|eukprot:NP_492374.1 Telomerase reverse transcriptase [Caenorhabditis elegans]
MSTFLASSENISNIRDTVVLLEINKLSQSILSSRNIFELRKLKPTRKMVEIEHCFVSKNDTFVACSKLISMFHLEKYIGSTNCANILEWITKMLNNGGYHKMKPFVYKEAPFTRAFRASKVMKNVDPNVKRNIQTSIVNNLKSGVHWWALMALRQVMIPIVIKEERVLLWRDGYLNILTKEIKDFKQRYIVQKAPHFIRPNVATFKLSISRQKLRPLFKRKAIDKKTETMQWKRLNSMLSWCLERSGVYRHTIRDSCKKVSDFLKKNSQNSKIIGYTADVSKCFSTVNHDVLISIIDRLFSQEHDIYTVCGKGRNHGGFHKLIFCSAGTELNAHEALRRKMELKGVFNFEVCYREMSSSTTLYSVIRTTLSTYYYKRGPTSWRITKGVPQGHPISSNLAHMYLNNFEQKYWSNEKEDSRIVFCRYEDDFIFITTENSLFEKMMKPLSTGNNTHFLTANPKKFKKSERCGASQVLQWCGVKLDFQSGNCFIRRRCKDGVARQFLIKLQ